MPEHDHVNLVLAWHFFLPIKQLPIMKWLLLLLMLPSCQTETKIKYCGIVMDKGYQDPPEGSMKYTPLIHYVILKVEGNFMQVNTTIPTFNKAQLGMRMCFDLTESEFLRYGNMHLTD